MGCGTNKLLRNGATLVTNAREIISSFKELNYKDEITNKHQTLPINVPEKYKEIFKLLSRECIDVNEISRKLKKPVNEINSLVFMMELEEYIEKNADGTYKPKEE